MKTSRNIAFAAAVTLMALVPAFSFGGEDPLLGKPWHHEDITRNAGKAVGFTPEAASTLAWHADYVDSYLYNPLWWAPGGVGRFKAALAGKAELEKVHFDDLFAGDQVRYMWRRYLSGTIAGLMYAKEKGDVSLAQNIVGVSLHAVQDFYSHSNWVDEAPRRGWTYLQMPADQRVSLSLYTGAYEHPEHAGVKSHGKYAPEAALFNQPGIASLLDLASSGFSPIQNMPLMQSYRLFKGQSIAGVEPYVPLTNLTTRLPKGILYLSPAGIALDNTWLAEIGVKQRGITDATGAEIFEVAKGLATKASEQWLRKIEEVMGRTGNGDFWARVKSEGQTEAARTREFENFSRLPFQFVSAGVYPPPSPVPADNTEEVYLRVRVKTGTANFAGTNADIRLTADGRDLPNSVGAPKTLLDYMPGSAPLVAFDDHEAGDDLVYTVGPFPALPGKITLHNDAPGAGDLLAAAGRTFSAIGNTIGSAALSLIGGHADHVGTRKKLWTAADLAAIPASGQGFTLDIDGGDEGHYRVQGTIRKIAEGGGDAPDAWHEYQVKLDRLDCVRESKFDRFSNSDEPFVLALLCPLPGGMQKFRTQPFNDVDKGENNAIGHAFATVRLPKKGGMLNLPVSVLESDDETNGARDSLLNAFAGENEGEKRQSEQGFLQALDSMRAADWQLDTAEVYAFTRNGAIRAGTVYSGRPDRWVEARQSVDLPLNTQALKMTGISTDELVTISGPIKPPVWKRPTPRRGK